MLFFMWSSYTCPIVSVCSEPCVFIIQILKLCVLAGLLLFFEFVETLKISSLYLGTVAVIFFVESLHQLYCFGM